MREAGCWALEAGRRSGSAEGAGLGSLRDRARSGPPWPMFLPASLRCLVFRSAQRLRGVRGAKRSFMSSCGYYTPCFVSEPGARAL